MTSFVASRGLAIHLAVDGPPGAPALLMMHSLGSSLRVWDAQARALADMMGLPATALKMGSADAAPKTPMKLTLGADFKGAGISLNAPQKAPEDIQRVEADKAICAK